MTTPTTQPIELDKAIQIATAYLGAMKAVPISTRLRIEETSLSCIVIDKLLLAAKHQAHLDRLGIKTLDAKWLDPECHKGCQSLAIAKRSIALEAKLKEVEKENEGLRQTLDRANEIHKSLEVAIGQQCLPAQMPRFVSDTLSQLRADYKLALEALGQLFPDGLSLHEYLFTQYPATQGNILLRDFCIKQDAILSTPSAIAAMKGEA